MTEFFTWAESLPIKYVVLRGYQHFKEQYPAPGAKEDIDLLVEDRAINLIQKKYGHYKKHHGTKCDIYDVTGAGIGGYLGTSYFPVTLSESTLNNRHKWNDRFYVPNTQEHLLTLLYHIAYQKAEVSKIGLTNEKHSQESKYIDEINRLTAELGISIPLTLNDIHAHLKRKGLAAPYEAMIKILENDFQHHVKSLFRALVCLENKGEMNLFVIRSSAFKKDADQELIKNLKQQYQVLALKHIPWHQRYLRARHMRGGKWRRGGYPAIAVVVYDPNPKPSAPDDREIHPYVFNSKQFAKRDWREWYTRHTGAKPSTNPIHSTDNEAEAIGHLPFFFDESERAHIYEQLRKIRQA